MKIEGRRLPIYSLLIVFLSSILMGIVAIEYANYVDSQSNKELCEMIVAVDDAFKDVPAAGPSGQKVAEAFHHLRIKFNC